MTRWALHKSGAAGPVPRLVKNGRFLRPVPPDQAADCCGIAATQAFQLQGIAWSCRISWLCVPGAADETVSTFTHSTGVALAEVIFRARGVAMRTQTVFLTAILLLTSFFVTSLLPIGAAASPELVRGTLTNAAVTAHDGDLVHGSILGGLVMDSSWSGTSLLIQGFWFPADEVTPSSVEDGGGVYLFQMNQNAPNPFNPRTMISFVIAGSSGGNARVSLLVFDVQGRLVRTLIDDSLSAGPHATVWDGRNDNGAALASGIYCVRLTAGSHTAKKQLVLLK